jgi:hypothetical protein
MVQYPIILTGEGATMLSVYKLGRAEKTIIFKRKHSIAAQVIMNPILQD